jgi:DNA modification methylase
MLQAFGEMDACIVWAKNNFGLGGNYRPQHEFILFRGKIAANDQSDLWPIGKDAAAEYQHPTQKPVALVAKALGNSSSPSALVFDGFLGSGTTLIACEKEGRRCYGTELEPKYADVVVARWERATGREAELLERIEA